MRDARVELPEVLKSLLTGSVSAAVEVVSTSGAAARLPEGSFPLITWEIRGRTLASHPGAVELDGGCRIEWLEPVSLEPLVWRFAVGAGPDTLRSLARGHAPEPSGAEPLLDWLAGALRALDTRARAVLKLVEQVGTGATGIGPESRSHQPSVRTWMRLRGWSRGGEAPRTALDRGVRIDAGGPGLAWLGSEPELAPWLGAGRESWLDSASREQEFWQMLNTAPAAELAPEYRGPLVLARTAAAWWTHEMAHAALEEAAPHPAAIPATSGAQVVDDATRCTWPVASPEDDLGRSARAIALWTAGEKGDLGLVHHRRASIRDPALPTPTATFLLAPIEAMSTWADLAAGLPVALSASAGRFDPLRGEILLWCDQLAVTDARGLRPVSGSRLIRVNAEQAWRSLRIVRDDERQEPSHAVCTRQGQMHPVMVGAPTVVLDPVRL